MNLNSTSLHLAGKPFTTIKKIAMIGAFPLLLAEPALSQTTSSTGISADDFSQTEQRIPEANQTSAGNELSPLGVMISIFLGGLATLGLLGGLGDDRRTYQALDEDEDGFDIPSFPVDGPDELDLET